ncbi:lamina-associated polypeptide 2, isoforms beta/delta/epsilon/gamma-like isoform X1 [Notolabrus celidotus]|uniref:lamina-associated polypeptide 2, isoforms beta/delta/epsilon/gamma-like isoform X1 n=1 Tax=Notolabrus celidotus TaxID=1203425 RepID=UPI00148FD37A|nr:lamina-associated polypeptide 2, isoforms beta/delta/epsilon/gamma-like isoform X1 [Notolabrus celidotus]
MSSLSSKSTQEIIDLLDDYGIKHGPVVDSTRSLYERKIKEAMARGKKVKLSPDKTFYREEEEEVTYVYRAPVRSDGAGDSGSYSRSQQEWTEREHDGSFSRSRPEWTEREHDVSFSRPKPEWTQREHEKSYSGYTRTQPEYRGKDTANEPYMYDTPSTYRSSYLKSTPMKPAQQAPQTPQSSRLIPLWVQFVFFLAVAAFLYIVFSSMETNESLKGLE